VNTNKYLETQCTWNIDRNVSMYELISRGTTGATVSAAELQGWMAVAAQPPAGGKRERIKMEKKSAEKRASVRISKHSKETTQERDRR